MNTELPKEIEDKILDALLNAGADIGDGGLEIKLSRSSAATLFKEDHTAEVLVRFEVKMLSEEEKINLERKQHADAILAHNMEIGKCISCGRTIYGDQTVVDTIHGQYHDTCVNGRKDSSNTWRNVFEKE